MAVNWIIGGTVVAWLLLAAEGPIRCWISPPELGPPETVTQALRLDGGAMSDYFGRDGQPMTSEEWSAAFSDWSYKVVEKSDVGDMTVSTVWLGLDHGYGDGPPVIFETMIFGGPLDQNCWRYSTLEEARAGHETAKAEARAAIDSHDYRVHVASLLNGQGIEADATYEGIVISATDAARFAHSLNEQTAMKEVTR